MAKNDDHKGIERITTTLGQGNRLQRRHAVQGLPEDRRHLLGEIVSTGFLYVEQGATITANIRVGSVVVGGTVKGNIEATEKLEMLSTGKVYGNIRTAKLKIADGVVFEGKCEMIKNPQARQRLLRPGGAAEEEPARVCEKPGPGTHRRAHLGGNRADRGHHPGRPRPVPRQRADARWGSGCAAACRCPTTAALFRAELAARVADADLVIITGGLGPTSDDLTREIVAEAAGVPLEFHPEAWDALLARFAGPHRVGDQPQAGPGPARASRSCPTRTARRRASTGSARGALVVALPGPPSELRPMFAASVLPLLAGAFRRPARRRSCSGARR